jgi:hypothetical protein
LPFQLSVDLGDESLKAADSVYHEYLPNEQITIDAVIGWHRVAAPEY